MAHAPDLKLTAPVWTNRARFQDRIASVLRRGRGLLAGDAAHVWAPIGGHGMNTGMRGAHNLAWKLAAVHRGAARPSLLDTYSDEQRGNARAVMDEMRFNVLERPNGRLIISMLRAVMPIALASEAVRSRVEFTLSDFGMHYRESTLSWNRASGGPLRAGDRVPDAAVLAGGLPARLHDLLSLRHWTLLLHSDDGDGQALKAACAVADRFRVPIRGARITPRDEHARVALGRERRMILARPDGHSGLIARLDDTRALAEYLDTFFVRV